MLGLRQRIAFTAVLLIGLVPPESKAQDCYALIQRDYQLCMTASAYPNLGQCANRQAEQLAICASTGRYPGFESQKDQCLNRVEAEYRACGYRAVCTNAWLQGLAQCN